jgi:hypothetical protein
MPPRTLYLLAREKNWPQSAAVSHRTLAGLPERLQVALTR